MNTEDSEFERIAEEAKRRAAQKPSIITLQQAAQQALEALELLAKYENPATKIQVRKPKDGGPIVTMYPHKVATEAAAPLRERLAQPEHEPVAWKLVPIEPTNEMIKAMDECSTEGYDERLLAGHAASVYMAAVNVAPTPPQRNPLNHEQRFDLLTKFEAHKHEWHAPAILIDMVEAAHGIKETQK